MDGTSKVGSTGRYGPRYGIGIRRKLLKVEPLQLKRHACPGCGSASVKRKSRGIFSCRKCQHTFIGGAYLPQTLAGGIISKMVSQKMFAPEMVSQLTMHEEAVGKAAAVSEQPAHEPSKRKPKKPREKAAEQQSAVPRAAESEGSEGGDSEGEESESGVGES